MRDGVAAMIAVVALQLGACYQGGAGGELVADLPADTDDAKSDSLGKYAWKVALDGLRSPGEPEQVLPDGTYLGSCAVEQVDATHVRLATRGYVLPKAGAVVSGRVVPFESGTPAGWPLGQARADGTPRFALLRVDTRGPTATVVTDTAANIGFFAAFEVVDADGDGTYDAFAYETIKSTGERATGRLPLAWDPSVVYAVAPITRSTPDGTALVGTFGLGFNLDCRATPSDQPRSCKDVAGLSIWVP
jgi:hypothetical protein